MEIDILLKKVLSDHGLDRHGIAKDISDALECHRHTIGKLYRNQLVNPSLKTLGELCTWLERRGVPGHILPQALFGARPSELWQTMARPGTVTFYLGEYRQTQTPAPARRWIALRDAAVMAKIIEVLSSSTELAQKRLAFQARYVPFHFSGEGTDVEMQHFLKDAQEAEATFDRMRSQASNRTSILIGSQRVNLLVEVMVAKLFGAKMFRPSKQRPVVPFTRIYRESDRPVPSCFGGVGRLPGSKRPAEPGIHYRNENEEWVSFLWKENQLDAGIVITVYEPGTQTLEMTLFGFSGRGTAAMGKAIEKHADRFWPAEVEKKGKMIGVYICQFELSEDSPADSEEDVIVKRTEIVPLTKNILQKYLA